MRPVGRSGPALASTLTIATTGGLLAVSGAPASAASSCASPAYKRQFYPNTTFSDTPKKTDCDAAVGENWGTKAPASGLPKDNFGVRWTVTRDFGSPGDRSRRGGQRVRAFRGRRRRARGPHPAARRHRADGHPDRVRLRAGVGQEPGHRLGRYTVYWGELLGDEGSAEPAQGFRIYRWNPVGDWVVTEPAR
ncbi:hypothetical protein ABZ402_16565 [Streptomyces mirabilis]|uniref:hypothetical protein n=1 Tax=Streptomyces mirabilis TaxID=68239 RepID=UPI0033C5CBF8